MSKIDLVKYKAIDRGWTKKDLQRVHKKIVELADQFDGGSIMFNVIEDLAMMLDEDIDYKLEYSLCRLVQDGKLFLSKIHDGSYILEVAQF